MIKKIARLSIELPLYTWLLILFALFGGALRRIAVIWTSEKTRLAAG